MAQHIKSTWAKDSIILGLKLFPQISFKCNVQHTVKGNWADGEKTAQERVSSNRRCAASAGVTALGEPAAESPMNRLAWQG